MSDLQQRLDRLLAAQMREFITPKVFGGHASSVSLIEKEILKVEDLIRTKHRQEYIQLQDLTTKEDEHRELIEDREYIWRHRFYEDGIADAIRAEELAKSSISSGTSPFRVPSSVNSDILIVKKHLRNSRKYRYGV